MPYVQREAGEVVGLFRNRFPGVADEFLDDDDAEVAAFLQPPVPAISDRQFAQQLAVVGTITEAEAIAWAARGELPSAMEGAVGQLPAGEQFAARMLLSSATTYEFTHPLTSELGALLGFSEDQIRSLWIAAARL